MAADRYTGLFFLDDATALAAGHRPCAECRNARWTPGGYPERRPRSRGGIEVVTPATSLRVLASGWRGSLPLVHPRLEPPTA
jgi:hypothetical protein